MVVNPFTNRGIALDCLLDTGADASLMPGFIATMTGHDLKNAEVERNKTQGVGGVPLVCYKHTFILKIMSFDRKKLVWESERLLIDCVEHNNVPPLLGTEGVLSSFSTTFNYKQNSIIITT